MKALSTCVLLALLTSPGAALAADARPAKPSMDLKVPPYSLDTQVFDFPTGLRVIMQSDRTSPVVMTYTVVNNGTKDDPKGKEETAHFVEHTWFRSKHGTLPPVMDLIQDIGTIFNASTRNDYTDYWLIADQQYLPLMLKLESLRLTEPYAGVTEAEIDIEREVIRSEWRRRSEQAEIAPLLGFLYESVYPVDHPYHDHSNHDSIDNIKLADLQKFFDDYYKPENTTITVVGNFDPDEAASLIFANLNPKLLHPRLTEKDYVYAPKAGIAKPDPKNPDHWLTFAYDPDSNPNKREPLKLAPREAPRITDAVTEVPPLGTTEVKTKYGPVANRTVAVGWSLPGGYRSDSWNLQMLGNTTAGYVTQGLTELIENDQLAEPLCGTLAEIVNSTLLCAVEILDKKLDPLQVRDKMVDQLSQMWNPENFTPNTPQNQYYSAILQRSKYEVIADLLLSVDQFALRSETLGVTSHYNNNLRAVSAGMDAVLAIDPSIVAKLGDTYLKRNRAATVIIEPLAAEDIDVGSEKSSYSGARTADSELRMVEDLSKITPAQIADAYSASDLSAAQQFELPNKLKVIVIPHGEAPIASASVLFGRNADEEPPILQEFVSEFTQSVAHDPLAIAAFVNWTFQPGVPGVTPNTALPLLGGTLRGSSYEMNIRVPSGNLDAGLWILREEIETARPYVDGKTRFIDRQKDDIQAGWSSRTFFVNQAVNDFMYPGDPSRRDPTWEEYLAAKAWTGTEVTAYLDKLLRPENATLVIVGNLDPNEAKKLAEQYFGGWVTKSTASVAASTPAKMTDQASKILVYDVPKATQTDVRRYCRLNVDSAADRAAVDVLGSLIGNRVFSTMRVKEGLAYSPNAGTRMSDDLTAALTFDSNGAINKGVGRMVQFFDQTVQDVASGKVADDELTLHRLREARNAGLASQSITDLSNLVLGRLSRGDDLSSIGNWGEQLAAVSREDLQSLMASCADHSIVTIEGPKDVVLPQLDELGYTYDVVEWRGLGEELLYKYDPKEAKKREKQKQKDAKKDAKKPAGTN
jgi:zinc protease